MRSTFPLVLARAGLLLLAATGTAAAADFGFAVIIQLGGAATWEVGIGPRGSAPVATTSVNPDYQDNTPRRFEVGYTQATNTAFVRVYQTNNVNYQQATYQPVGGAPLLPAGSWTLPASSFSVAADAKLFPTSVTVDNLGLSAGLTVLQPLSTTTLTASQTGIFGGVDIPSASLGSPVQFRAQGTGGNWMLSGRITFASWIGLGGFLAPTGNDLRFGFDAGASDVPEPSTALYLGCGLGLLGLYSLRRRR